MDFFPWDEISSQRWSYLGFEYKGYCKTDVTQDLNKDTVIISLALEFKLEFTSFFDVKLQVLLSESLADNPLEPPCQTTHLEDPNL